MPFHFVWYTLADILFQTRTLRSVYFFVQFLGLTIQGDTLLLSRNLMNQPIVRKTLTYPYVIVNVQCEFYTHYINLNLDDNIIHKKVKLVNY